MKRLSLSRTGWLTRRANNQERRRRSKFRKRKANIQRLLGFSTFIAPSDININEPKCRSNTLSFVSEIRNAAISGKRKIHLDFTSAKALAAGGTIILLAELTRLRHAFKDLVIKSTPPRNGKAAQVMKQTGIAKVARTNIKTRVRDHDVVNWNCATGEGAQGQQCDKILGPYDGLIAESLSDQLYRGLTEAMTNAHHHAYYSQRGDGITCSADYRPWWMFSQEKDGYLTVIFCDLGLGIPTTLPVRQQKWWARIKRFGIDEKGDAKLIQGAVRNSQSRTRMLHRGKGLRQIAETVNSAQNGRVLIFSNRGVYRLESGIEYVQDYTDSIMGTVIQWRMPLPLESRK